MSTPAGPAPLAELQARLGVDVGTAALDLALTHRSWAYEAGGVPSNERLEFLGDAVLGVVVTDALFRAHPDLPEGRLAKMRASVVSSRALAEVGRALGLGAYLRLGRGEEATGGRDKSSILADAVEAVLGAVYLEAGLDVAAALVHRLVGPAMARAGSPGAGLDWKTSLQELASSGGLGAPVYEVHGSGPDHDRSFSASVLLGGTPVGTGGAGRTKKEAEQEAASSAVAALSPDRGLLHDPSPQEPPRQDRPRGPAQEVRLPGGPSRADAVAGAGSGGTSPTTGS